MTNKEIYELRMQGHKLEDIAETARMQLNEVNKGICAHIDTLIAKSDRMRK